MLIPLLLLLPINLNPIHTLRLLDRRHRPSHLSLIICPIITHSNELLLRLPPILILKEHLVHGLCRVVLVLKHLHIGLGLVGGFGEVVDLEVLQRGDLALRQVLEFVEAERRGRVVIGVRLQGF